MEDTRASPRVRSFREREQLGRMGRAESRAALAIYQGKRSAEERDATIGARANGQLHSGCELLHTPGGIFSIA